MSCSPNEPTKTVRKPMPCIATAVLVSIVASARHRVHRGSLHPASLDPACVHAHTSRIPPVRFAGTRGNPAGRIVPRERRRERQKGSRLTSRLRRGACASAPLSAPSFQRLPGGLVLPLLLF